MTEENEQEVAKVTIEHPENGAILIEFLSEGSAMFNTKFYGRVNAAQLLTVGSYYEFIGKRMLNQAEMEREAAMAEMVDRQKLTTPPKPEIILPGVGNRR